MTFAVTLAFAPNIQIGILTGIIVSSRRSRWPSVSLGLIRSVGVVITADPDVIVLDVGYVLD